VELQSLAEDLQRRFDDKMAAREKALPAARRAIRASANAIRAIHRGDLDQAGRLLEEAASELAGGRAAVEQHPDVRYAGFLHDAEKEYAEARLTEVVIGGKDVPTAEELDVTPAAYLNGMAETIGEARRAVLDLLRQGDVDRSEELLRRMEDMYHVLVTIDYPDAITGNLRRSTDVARGIMEKTRGDLSISIVQRRLHDALDRHARDVLGDQG
jgi:translin